MSQVSEEILTISALRLCTLSTFFLVCIFIFIFLHSCLYASLHFLFPSLSTLYSINISWASPSIQWLSLSLSSALDPPTSVTWFPLTLHATLAPLPLRRHPPTHTHGRPTVGSVFLRGRLWGDVAGVNNGSLSVMMDHSSIWCPPVRGGADFTV